MNAPQVFLKSHKSFIYTKVCVHIFCYKIIRSNFEKPVWQSAPSNEWGKAKALNIIKFCKILNLKTVKKGHNTNVTKYAW